jgi:hypothetical protein
MGANAQTTVPTFTASQVLTAAEMNASARTGVPVFSTTGTRDAAFGGTGEKTLAEGQMCYVEGTGLQTYNGTSWITWGTAPSTGGLELITAQTIGSAVASVTVSNVFSSTYDDYLVRLSAGAASTSADLNLTFGATTTGYYWSFTGTSYANAAAKNGAANAASIVSVGNVSSNGYSSVIDIQAPNLAKNTVVRTNYVVMATDASTGTINGYVNNTTAYTAFTLTTTSGTLTGGTIYVYGYKK